MKSIFILLGFIGSCYFSSAQNTGIGIMAPVAKLHIKGNADTSQFVIDAASMQSNAKPLIKLRNSNGGDILWLHADNTTNLFLGLNAGLANDGNGGNYNTFLGSMNGKSNVTGYSNTSGGNKALYSNISGAYNTANGVISLYFNTAGDNTANGFGALYSNSTGNSNTAFGSGALYNNTTGNSITAAGYFSNSFSNTTGNYNSITGLDALNHNTSGNANTANGLQSLFNNTAGNNNTAMGNYALNKNNSGYSNTALGHSAAYDNTSGTDNTAVGLFSYTHNITSSYNTAFGHGAGPGGAYFTGWNNTVIGQQAEANAAGIYNSIAVGRDAASTANNQARFGNSFTTSIGGYTNWSNISDARVKTNIRNNVPGLAFINKLKPITYTLSLDAIDYISDKAVIKDTNGKTFPPAQFELDSKKQKEQIVYSGFIAQDVEKAARELGYVFSGVDTAKDNKDFYGLRYEEFVVPLVKAVQELATTITKLEEDDGEQIQQIEKLKQAAGKQKKMCATLQKQIDEYRILNKN